MGVRVIGTAVDGIADVGIEVVGEMVFGNVGLLVGVIDGFAVVGCEDLDAG